jgi:aldehyde dehydrogenase (NAD+)
MDSLRVGHPLDKCIDVGALADPAQASQLRSAVETAVAEGSEPYQAKTGLEGQGAAFFPPTLLTNVSPSSSVWRDELFGPILACMTFRTAEEAILLANNTRYGLSASMWSESISRSLDVATRILAGVVWINSTNLFDAAVGFGGYRESGYGREGGREGAYEYLKPKAWDAGTQRVMPPVEPATYAQHSPVAVNGGFSVDRTAKLYIGGKQVRPDGGYTQSVYAPSGMRVGEVGAGNRKDIRNAVASARAADRWSKATAHNRAQVLYYIAENLSARRGEFEANLVRQTDCTLPDAKSELDACIARLFSYGAWADKFEGTVHSSPMDGLVFAMHEPIGVVGVVCPPERPLLAFISLVAPNIAMGNRVVAIPSESWPLGVIDFYQVLDASDLPAGVVNIVTGKSADLAKTLAEHEDVDAIWAFHTANRLRDGGEAFDREYETYPGRSRPRFRLASCEQRRPKLAAPLRTDKTYGCRTESRASKKPISKAEHGRFWNG